MTSTNALAGLLLTIAAVMKEWGWRGVVMFGMALVFLFAVLVYSKAPARVGIPLPTKIVAFEPGSEFDVAQFCQKKATVLTTLVAPDASGIQRIAARPGQQVVWTENDTGEATLYSIDRQGQQVSELVLVTEAAAKCLRTAR